MNRDLPSFPAVRAFEAAARHSSFKEAAQELHVTQSAISHQVRALEEHLGVELFRRATRGVALSREGEAYFARVGRILDQLASATREIRGQAPRGPLHVRATPAFAARWLIPRINEFNRLHPDIELHISTSLDPADFTGDGIDIDIRFGDVERDDLHAEPFLASSRFPVSSPRLFDGTGPPRRPADLARYTLLHNEVEDGWQDWFEQVGAGSVDASPGPRFEHCNLTLRAASEAQGIALAYDALVTEDLHAGRLVRLFDLELPATVIYSLLCPRRSLKHPRVSAFRHWLAAAAAASPGQGASSRGTALVQAVG